MKIERIGDVAMRCLKSYYALGRALSWVVSRSQVRRGGWEHRNALNHILRRTLSRAVSRSQLRRDGWEHTRRDMIILLGDVLGHNMSWAVLCLGPCSIMGCVTFSNLAYQMETKWMRT